MRTGARVRTSIAPGPAGPRELLPLSPYHAVNNLYARGWVQPLTDTSLYQRAMEIGASDFGEDGDD